MIDIKETVNGLRIDTFLADMETLSEEDTQPHRSFEEEIAKKLFAVLRRRPKEDIPFQNILPT